MGRHRRGDEKSCYKKYCKVTAEDARAKNLKVFKTEVCTLKTDSLDAENYTLDGISLNEMINSGTTVGLNSGFDPVACDPSQLFGCYTPFCKEDCLNRTVFDYLLQVGYEAAYGPGGLQERVDEGRVRLGLPPSPGVQLVGSISLPAQYKSFPDDLTKADFISFYKSIGFNLQFANTLEFIDGYKPNPLLASFYVHLGWIDSVTKEPRSMLLDIGNQQVNPTIDYKFDPDFLDVESWGQRFAGNTSLNTDTILQVGETGVVQLLIFRERGLTLYFPDETGTCAQDPECRINSGVTSCSVNCSTDTTGNIGIDINVLRVARRLEI